jgi:hypothetical protein
MSITLGAHTKVESAFSSTLTTSAQTTQVSGSTLIAFAYSSNAVTMSDSKGNTWISAGTQAFNGGFGDSGCYYCQNAVGGSGHTFTATQSGGSLQLIILELIGAVTSGGPNAFAHANVTGASPPITTPSITTTVANAAVVACTAGASNVNVAGTSTNGTVLDSISGANFVTGTDSWFLKTTAGATNDTLTFAGQSSFDEAAYSIAFAPAGAGGVYTLSVAEAAVPIVGESVALSWSAASHAYILVVETGLIPISMGPAFADSVVSVALLAIPVVGKTVNLLNGGPLTSIVCAGGSFDALTPMPGLML